MGFLWESDTGNYERTHTAYLKRDLYLILLEHFFIDESRYLFWKTEYSYVVPS